MKFALCDDDFGFLNFLEDEIKKIDPNIETISFRKGTDLLEYVSQPFTMFDAIFLDIKMPTLNGIEVATEIQKMLPDISLVIMTGYENLVVKGLWIGALHYLLKPVTKKELSDVILRISKEINTTEPFYIHRSEKGFRVRILCRDIISIESEGHYKKIKTHKETYRSRDTMSSLTKTLTTPSNPMNYKFIRVHRSYIINLKYVQELDMNKRLILMVNGEVIPVSESFISSCSKALFEEWDNQYYGYRMRV